MLNSPSDSLCWCRRARFIIYAFEILPDGHSTLGSAFKWQITRLKITIGKQIAYDSPKSFAAKVFFCTANDFSFKNPYQ